MVEIYHLQTSGHQQFVYNLTSNVGTKSQNRHDDVALVQLGFRSLAQSDSFMPSADDQRIFGAVEWTGTCTGDESDLLVKAIRHFQNIAPNGIRDGHVSTFKEHDTIFRVGTTKGTFILSDLTAAIIELHRDKWPNIHRIPGCPSVLSSKIAMMMSDTSFRPFQDLVPDP